MPVAGPAFYPWGKPHGHPYGSHPMGEVGNLLIKGFTALGIPVAAAALLPSCPHRTAIVPMHLSRFLHTGCKVGAKASTLVTHVPDAIAHGAEIRDNSMAVRISMDKDGRTDGIVYYDSEGTRPTSLFLPIFSKPRQV
jgi:hypothetical protein